MGSPWLLVSSPGGGSDRNYDWWTADRANELGSQGARADAASGSALSRKLSRHSGPINIPHPQVNTLYILSFQIIFQHQIVPLSSPLNFARSFEKEKKSHGRWAPREKSPAGWSYCESFIATARTEGASQRHKTSLFFLPSTPFCSRNLCSSSLSPPPLAASGPLVPL